ncbi:UbiA prenyltransferase family protein [Micromonospora sp. B11E3]|uniref:UbiA prenyltransferase family protein n=1 Tax=Micromonospora sp. B11E3 TaxID=3153562 RepID=UPI00325F603A
MRATESAVHLGGAAPGTTVADGRPGPSAEPGPPGVDGTAVLDLGPPVTPTGLARLARLPGALAVLLRPGQWPKNVLVVPVALLTAGAWTPATLARLGWAVLAFTLASALVYVVNDVVDRDRDRRHPVKRHRPVASGLVPVPVAWAVAVGLAGLLAATVARAPGLFWPLWLYLGLNVAYSLRLKQVPLVDVFTLAAGFVLRALQGYAVTGLAVSGWLLTCVFAICLVLALGKRRHEIMVAGAEHRPALVGYTVHLIDNLVLLNAAVAVTTYLLFLDSDAGATRYGPLLSAPFAMFGISRYLQLLLVHRQGGDPTRILVRDRAMLVNALMWAAFVAGPLLASR